MEIPMRGSIARAIAVTLLLVGSGTLQAAPVRGEDVPLNVDQNGQPTDPKIAEIQKVVHVKYEPFSSNFEALPRIPLDVNVQCISQVFRNEQTGFLTFKYSFDVVGPGTSDGFSEGSSGSVRSFKGFAVNGFGVVDDTGRDEIIIDSAWPESSSGLIELISSISRGTQAPPRFVLATNATRFDQNGVATAHGEDEELLLNLTTHEEDLDLIKGDTTVTGVFEPTAAIPLPAAAYPAGMILTAMMIGSVAQRAHQKRVRAL
jgi:hypothetical protein